MAALPEDIYTEPDADPDTLANLGPLRAMAGVWRGEAGATVHPVAGGDEPAVYVEHYELQPTDPQTNGPQLFYGLRYHVHIVKPGEVETFHDQVGYWLWEPATGAVIQTIAIPRAQVALCGGTAAADATSFEVVARHGDPVYGICSGPFLEHAFRTVEIRVKVTANADGTWGYEEETVMEVLGREGLVHHTDANTLTLVEEPTPNPLALAGRPK
jgi:hypothetical protein